MEEVVIPMRPLEPSRDLSSRSDLADLAMPVYAAAIPLQLVDSSHAPGPCVARSSGVGKNQPQPTESATFAYQD
jgi:hypothetical protein